MWTAEECEHIAKGETWKGMTAFQREAAEESAAEIQGANRAARGKKNVKSAAAPATSTPIRQADSSAWIVALILGCLGAAAYLFPGIVASSRHHHQRSAIWVLNFFLGWTVLGWIGALIWASTATPEQTKV